MWSVSTFITRLDERGSLRVAVKDCIDVAGVPTTSGSPSVADTAEPAAADAPCLAGIRAAGAAIVGKANLHELCFGASGVNPWYGTPQNPFDARLVPGGSSSGSAVAVATGEADVGIGTDTTGSVRTPAAFCGVVGLRTTYGRIPVGGVQALAPSLDTIGPLARDVAGVVAGMGLLEPGFTVDSSALGWQVGRVRTDALPGIEVAVDRARAGAELDAVDVAVPGWADVVATGRTILYGEAWQVLSPLWLSRPERIGADVHARFETAKAVTAAALQAAYRERDVWRAALVAALEAVDALVFPTFPAFPPTVVDRNHSPNDLAMPASVAGVPAVSLPVPTDGPLPAGLQLVGRPGGEERLLALAARIEAAVA